jgi:hypothetical protein
MVDYKPMTEEEIKKLAKDIYTGLVFTDRHIQVASPGMIYEYMDKAGPMSINGMPMFCSFRFISQEDAKKVSQLPPPEGGGLRLGSIERVD